MSHIISNKYALSANFFRGAVTALFAPEDYNNNDVWQWKLVKIPHHFEVPPRTPRTPNRFIKHLFRLSIGAPGQRRLNNKYPRLHHLGHRSELNPVFQPSPPSTSVLHHVRAHGSALHHLKSPRDLLINATGFKWSPGVPRWRVQPVSL